MPKATIPIYHDDDFERMAELRLEVTIAERRHDAARLAATESHGAPLRLGDEDESDGTDETKAALQAARDAFNAFVDEAAERAELWVLKPIGYEEFRTLLREHPPRKVEAGEGDDRKEVTHPDDDGWGVNTETFPKALLLFVDPEDDEHRTVVEPAFDTEAALRKRVKRLSEGEFESMWVTAYTANKGGIADPKAVKF
jgi:hypothetical protein